MAGLKGLFRRGGSFYLKVILPETHPLREQYADGRFVQSRWAHSLWGGQRVRALRSAFLGFMAAVQSRSWLKSSSRV